LAGVVCHTDLAMDSDTYCQYTMLICGLSTDRLATLSAGTA
jgi:hypothetical protein